MAVWSALLALSPCCLASPLALLSSETVPRPRGLLRPCGWHAVVTLVLLLPVSVLVCRLPLALLGSFASASLPPASETVLCPRGLLGPRGWQAVVTLVLYPPLPPLPCCCPCALFFLRVLALLLLVSSSASSAPWSRAIVQSVLARMLPSSHVPLTLRVRQRLVEGEGGSCAWWHSKPTCQILFSWS